MTNHDDHSSIQRVGIQLYSVREQLTHDAKTCITQLAELGFTRAEGFDLTQLGQIKPMLDDVGIQVHSSFLLWSHVTERYDLAEAIRYPWMPKHQTVDYAIEQALSLGLDTVVCGYALPAERTSEDDYQRLADRLNRVGEQCAGAGLDLLYHNHCFEFKPFDHQNIPFFSLVQQTDPQWVNFEVDTLWCELGGYSLKRLATMLGNRLKQVHLKTGKPVAQPPWDESQYSPALHDLPLGQGVVDMGEVFEVLTRSNVQRAFIEQEFSADLYQSLGKSLQFVSESLALPS